jgi:hypothetical protein
MHQRCKDLNNTNYGSRGITVAPEWANDTAGFERFLADTAIPSSTTVRFHQWLRLFRLTQCSRKPDFPDGVASLTCPMCQKTSTFQRFELMTGRAEVLSAFRTQL